MLNRDPRRARVVASVRAPDAAPGDVEVRAIDGELYGYAYCCPGCGSADYLALAPSTPDGWRVTAGDPARPATVSLAPSILHRPCGWHGYLHHGEFTPC